MDSLLETARACLPGPRGTLLLKTCLLEEEPGLAAWQTWLSGSQDPLTELPPRLLPLLEYRLRGRELPGPLRVHLKAGLVRERKRFATLRALFAELQAALPPTVVYLKGPLLAERLYPEPALRHCHDLDLVGPVEPELLERFGYRFHRPIEDGSREYLHPSGAVVEVHRWLAGPPPYRLDRVTAEDPAGQLAAFCLLGFCRRPTNPWTWACDAFLLLRQHPELDWSRIPRLGLPLFVTLEFLARELGSPIPPEALERQRPVRLDGRDLIFALRTLRRSTGLSLARLVQRTPSWAGRLRLSAALAWPHPDYLEWVYPTVPARRRRLHGLLRKFDRRLPPPARLPAPEHTLLYRAACATPKEAAELFERWDREWGHQAWSPLVRRVAPVLRERLGQDAHRRVESLYQISRRQSRARLQWAERLLARLGERSVRPMLLKGAALLEGYVSDPALRPMADLDLLVAPEDFSTVVDCLGWRTAGPMLRHALELRGPEGEKLDLHRFALRDCRWEGVDEGLWRRSREADFLGARVRVPSPTDLLLLVCLHGTRGVSSPWPLDALAIVRSRGVDWELLEREAVRRRVTLPLAAALDYLATELEAPVPDSVRAGLSSRSSGLIDRLYFAWRGRPDKPGWLFAALELWRNQGLLEAAGSMKGYLRKVWGLEL